MVGEASLSGPGILAVLCAGVVTGDTTLYRGQPDRRAPEPAMPARRVTPPEQAAPPIGPEAGHAWAPRAPEPPAEGSRDAHIGDSHVP